MSIQIAETILKQIKAGSVQQGQRVISGTQCMMCWGFREPLVLSEYKDSLGGLRFKVSGLRFKGYVSVELAFTDTYTIKFITGGKVKKQLSDIYCDQLTYILDSYIETNQHDEAGDE